MSAYEPIGYLASLLVLATFSMRDMVSLRVVAIASNVAFIAYGALAEISPVLLHVVLLPLNMLRLAESVRSALRCRAEEANCALRLRVRSAVPVTGETEPAVASPLSARFTPRARPVGRSRKAATLQ